MTAPILGATSTPRHSSTSQGQTRLRLRIAAPDPISFGRVLEELTACCGITLQSVPAHPGWDRPSSHAIDLDLQGPLAGIQQALQRLQSFPITIQGRANPDGDGWHY